MVWSEPGVGSVFTLLLPDDGLVATPAATGIAARHVAEMPAVSADRGAPILRATPPTTVHPAPQLAGTKVLIVDDDVRNVFALTSALEMHGLEVLYADNGLDGIALLTEHPEVQIVLMDAMMPDLDGNATTRQIRTLPKEHDLPIVFLTAKAMPGDREASLAAGATDYITKPVDLDVLLTIMASWVTGNGNATARGEGDRA